MTGLFHSLWQTIARYLDEAIRVLEARRYRRILAQGRLPFVYAVGVFLVAGLLVPFFVGERGILSAGGTVARYHGWGAGVMLTTSALAAALAGYLRAQHLWHQERRLRTFHAWLMSYQSPFRAATTTIVMAAVLGLGLAGIPLVFSLLMALVSGVSWWQLLLSLLLIPLCALAGAAIGAAVFFISYNLVPRGLYYPGLAALALLAVALWLRIEVVQNGWHRGWEEHPGRIVQSLSLITPIPVLFGVSTPGWWDRWALPSLGWSLPVWQAALLYAALLILVAACAGGVAIHGYLRLAADPDLMEEKPQAPTEEGGREFYWKGFRNPMLTRDIRTRLRNKDTAEFIFFASIAVAAGFFVPLLMTTSDLSDPLLTARTASQVFFWLTMTLVALVSLIAPGLTADSITAERSSGALEMLVATPLRPREILWGKLMGAVCVMTLLVSPSFPLFGLCYLFHGASGPQVVSVYLLLLVTLTVSAFIGVTQSAINSKAGSAKFFAYGSTAAFVAVPGGPFWIAAAAAAPQAEMRQQLMSGAGVSALIGALAIFVLVLFWGNACEQLEYSEY